MNKRITIVIVDYKSTKQSNQLAQKLKNKNIKVIIVDNNKINRGFSKGANLGIKKGLEIGSDKILLLNPDVKIASSQIITLAESSFDVVSPILSFQRSNSKVFDYGGKVNFLLGRPVHQENAKPKNAIDFVSGASMMVDKKLFEKIGFFDEKFFMYFEDVDFCLRAKQSGYTVGVEEIIVEHALQEHKKTGDSFKKEKLIESNKIFIDKYVSVWAKPFAYLYLSFLKSR